LWLLSACVAQTPPYSADIMQPPSDSSTSPSSSAPAPTPADTTQASPSPGEAAQFNFPLATCGEQSSEPSATWYTVYIDNGDASQVRSRYCGDAISTTRAKSGTPTVQVASFTSYAKALTLAKAVGGVVEQVEQTAQATPDSSYQNAESPSAQAPANTAPAASTTSGMQVGQTAYLSASDPSTPINVRGNAGTDADIQTTGISGDRVQIANRAQGNDGFTWYQVRLDSGTTGWVRSDLVAAQAPTAQAPTVDHSADQSSQAQSPSQAPQTPYAQAPQAPAYDQSQVQPPAQAPYAQAPYGQAPYAQAPYGQAPYGQPQPPYAQAPYGRNRNSTLTARDPGAAINIREFASSNSRIRYYANPGAPVQISGSAEGDDGFTWYQVRFPSGAAGWVRSDLITAN
jgi:uncharacterized protein YgiM (DUF1202 family)